MLYLSIEYYVTKTYKTKHILSVIICLAPRNFLLANETKLLRLLKIFFSHEGYSTICLSALSV